MLNASPSVDITLGRQVTPCSQFRVQTLLNGRHVDMDLTRDVSYRDTLEDCLAEHGSYKKSIVPQEKQIQEVVEVRTYRLGLVRGIQYRAY